MSRTRAEILIGKALRDAYSAGLDAMRLTGTAYIPDPVGMVLSRALARAWRYEIKRSIKAVRRDLKHLEAKADDGLWQMLVDEYIKQFGAQAIRDILETTRRQIIEAVAKGLRDGKGIDAIAKEVREAFPRMARVRAHIIARTETHGAAQFASIETAKRMPFPVVKVWNSTGDHRTRDFGEADGKVDQANHRRMDGITAQIDMPFDVPNKWGGVDQLQYPGDPSAPAYQVVNCRCALSYRRAGRSPVA